MLRDEWVTRIGTLPGVVAARPFDGLFDLKALKRLAAKTPAVFVGNTSTTKASDESGEVAAIRRIVAIVVAKRGDERRATSEGAVPNDAAAVIADRIMAEVLLGERPPAGRGYAMNVKAVNRHSDALMGIGHSMWLVQWDQAEILDATHLDSVLDDLITIHTRYDIEPFADVEPVEDITDSDVDAASTTTFPEPT